MHDEVATGGDTSAQPNRIASAAAETPPHPSQKRGVRRLLSASPRWLALVLLGVAFPFVILLQAYLATDRLGHSLEGRATLSTFHASLPDAITKFDRPDSYRYAALLFLEASNQEVVLHKQQTKIAVMNIGFAVMCVGLSCILFGFDGGGFEGEAELESKKFRVKAASSGVAIFLLGALLSAGGGMLANDYVTAGAPAFSTEPTSRPATVEEMLVSCDEQTANELDAKSCRTEILTKAASVEREYASAASKGVKR